MNVFAKYLMLVCLLSCNTAFAQALQSMCDGEKRVYYTDMVDAKNKLIEYHKERCLMENKYKNDSRFSSSLFPFEMFKDLVLHDERAFNYNFSFSEIKELKSSDNKVKLYSWDNYTGGHTNRIYDGITTYKYNKKYYAYAMAWDGFDIASEQNGNIVHNNLDDLRIVTSALGKTVYLVFESARYEYVVVDEVRAYSLCEGNLTAELIFNVNNQCQYILSNNYQLDFGSKNLCKMKYLDGALWVSQKWLPEKLEGYTYPIASGLVDVYKYDGYLFNLEKTIYKSNEPLYKNLENFQKNICSIDLSPYTIRIDKMPNSTYRYSSWKNRKTNEVPDIIINNGLLLESISGGRGGRSVKEKYVFENNGYYYIVSFERVLYTRFISIEDAKLQVKRNDKTLMELKAK